MKKLNIKPIKQSRRMCGPASLQMVLDYYGKNKSEKELKEETNTTYFKGAKPQEIVKVAKRLGLKSKYSKNNSIDILEKSVEKGIPPIIGWFSPDSGSHYSVVTGFEKENILIADPEIGKIRKLKIKDFQKRWLDVNWEKFSTFKEMKLSAIMNLHRKLHKKSKKEYSPPIKRKYIVFGEMILITK